MPRKTCWKFDEDLWCCPIPSWDSIRQRKNRKQPHVGSWHPLAGCKNMFTECLLMLGHRKSVLASTPLFFFSWASSPVLGVILRYSMPAKAPQRCSQLSFPHGTTPPTAKKSHPNFFPHCKRSTKMKKYKNYHPKCANHHENASHPNGFKLWKIVNKMTCFNIKTPCKRMIHVCLVKYFFVANCNRI